METNSNLDTPIGDKEAIQLDALPVKVIDTKVEIQNNKQGKQIGEKVILMCKHPKKEWEQCRLHTTTFSRMGNWRCPFNLHEELKAGAP